MVAPSGDASGVVRVGLVDTFTPSFYIDVYTPLIESLKARLPQYRFETKEISHADAMKPESVENIDFVIVSSGGARMLSRAGLQQIATLRKSRCADVSRSVGSRIGGKSRADDRRPAGPQGGRDGTLVF